MNVATFTKEGSQVNPVQLAIELNAATTWRFPTGDSSISANASITGAYDGEDTTLEIDRPNGTQDDAIEAAIDAHDYTETVIVDVVEVPAVTTANLPAPHAAGICIVTDLPGGPGLAFCDGVAWRAAHNRKVI